jgi:hypothetical protein
MSGALVRYVVTHHHYDRLQSSGEYGIYMACDVDAHLASLRREHEQQLAALQAELAGAQAATMSVHACYERANNLIRVAAHAWRSDALVPMNESMNALLSYVAEVDRCVSNAARAGTP